MQCDEDGVLRIRRKIKDDDHAFGVDLGDKGEFITPKDNRFNGVRSISKWVDPDDIAESQYRKIIDFYKPIKSQMVGLLLGNHENDYARHQNAKIHDHICESLDITNLYSTAFIDFTFRREKSTEAHTFRGCFTHGSGNAITPGGKKTKLVRFMHQNEARFYGYGHVHSYDSHEEVIMTANQEGRIKQKTAVGALAGCFRRTYTQGYPPDYGETRLYPPSILGCAMFTINVNEDSVNVVRA